jgi:hypothetical protein
MRRIWWRALALQFMVAKTGSPMGSIKNGLAGGL